jgi:hypothetical protein
MRRRMMLVGALVCLVGTAACIPTAAEPEVRDHEAPAPAARPRITPEPVQPAPPTNNGVRDLAIAPSGDVAARIDQHDDGSAPPVTPTPRAEDHFTYQRDGFTFHDLRGAAVPYVPRNEVAKDDDLPRDADGVRMHEVAGKLYDHPNFQAGDGIANLESYRLTGDEFYLDRALVQARHLVEHRVESRGAWFYAYTFDFRVHGNPAETMRAPWYSGLAQGKVLSFFSRLATVTDDDQWREAADRTFASFLNPPSATEPWVSRVDKYGLLWLVEYPHQANPAKSDHVFNGHMSAIVGLWDYYRVSKDPVALGMYDGSITTMRRYLPIIRVPDRASLYCVPHATPASGSYHTLHISQFVFLWLMTGKPEFVGMADTLRDDAPPPVLEDQRVVEFRADAQVGYTFDLQSAAVLDRDSETVQVGSTGTTIRRMRIGHRGIFYRMASSPLEGRWVQEGPDSAMVRGPIAEVNYKGLRYARLLPGRTYVGQRFNAAGDVVDTKEVVPADEVEVWFDRSAWVNGVRAGHMAVGPLAGTWVATADVDLL